MLTIMLSSWTARYPALEIARHTSRPSEFRLVRLKAVSAQTIAIRTSITAVSPLSPTLRIVPNMPAQPIWKSPPSAANSERSANPPHTAIQMAAKMVRTMPFPASPPAGGGVTGELGASCSCLAPQEAQKTAPGATSAPHFQHFILFLPSFMICPPLRLRKPVGRSGPRQAERPQSHSRAKKGGSDIH